MQWSKMIPSDMCRTEMVMYGSIGHAPRRNGHVWLHQNQFFLLMEGPLIEPATEWLRTPFDPNAISGPRKQSNVKLAALSKDWAAGLAISGNFTLRSIVATYLVQENKVILGIL